MWVLYVIKSRNHPPEKRALIVKDFRSALKHGYYDGGLKESVEAVDAMYGRVYDDNNKEYVLHSEWATPYKIGMYVSGVEAEIRRIEFEQNGFDCKIEKESIEHGQG